MRLIGIYKISCLLIFVNLIFLQNCQNSKSHKIAIIGSGIGASSIALNLEKTFGDIQIIAFEKEDRIGGRTHTVEIAGEKKELGAHFIISDNFYVKDLVEELKLNLIPDNQLQNPDFQVKNQNFGIFKDSEFKFISSLYGKFINLSKMVWRYGLSFFQFMLNQMSFLRRFKKIYIFQENNEYFETVEDFLDVVGQYDLFNKTAEQVFIDDLGSGQLFADEMLDSILSNFYNQNYNVNGFAGMLGAAGLQGQAKVIKEGTNAIPDNIFKFKLRRTELKMQSEVQQIIYDDKKEKYHIKYYDHQKDEVIFQNDFELVIIAAPLEMSNITFSKNIDFKPQHRKTQTIYKYVVASKNLNPETFKLQKEEEIPSSFMSPDRLFGKISVLGKFCENCYSFQKDEKDIKPEKGEKSKKKEKIDNSEKIEDSEKTELDQNIFVFTGIDKITHKEMRKLFGKNKYEIILTNVNEFPYPDLADSRGKKLPPIVINQGLFYLNSMEFAGSCMELEVISGVNILNMIKNNQGADWEFKNEMEKKSIKKKTEF